MARSAAGGGTGARWPSGGRRARRRRRLAECGAQSLEWLALGSFVATMMGGATLYAHSHGGELGGLLLNHLRSVIGQ
jgi:hypothetical protein